MRGYTKKIVERRFALWADELGLERTKWSRVENGNRCTVGTVELQYYMGWHIECTSNDRGGVHNLNGDRMNHSEIVAWMDGTLWLYRERLAKS